MTKESKQDWKFYVTVAIAVTGYLLGGISMFSNLNADVEKLEVRIEYITKEIADIKRHVYHIRYDTADIDTSNSGGVL